MVLPSSNSTVRAEPVSPACSRTALRVVMTSAPNRSACLRADVVSSAPETPVGKPHADAFGLALAAIGATDPSRVVFVGDRPWDDVHGAQRAGMRAILVPHSDIPPHQQVPVDVTPDAVVHRLGEVLDVVRGWNLGS